VSNSTQAAETSLQIRRTFAAPRATVFAAFIEPATLLRWLGPNDCTMNDVTFDARVGGAFRFVYTSPKFGVMEAVGIVTALRAPEHLAYTWRWREDDPKDEHESAVRIDFIEHGSGTEIVFVHENLASPESRDRHEGGWTSALDHLATHLAGETARRASARP
jgi:glutathione S-transferase